MRLILCFIAAFVIRAVPVLASPQALNLKDVPDDARATIAKELARKNRQQAEGGDTTDDAGDSSRAGGKNSCSMEVGSQNRSSPAQRRTITVVTGPVVQMCK